MAWFDRYSFFDYKWSNLICITCNTTNHGENTEILYKITCANPFENIFKEILRKFLSEIDSRELVTFQTCNELGRTLGKRVVGITSFCSKRLVLYCIEEDVEKLLTDEPVRFWCYTEIEVEDKNKFIGFIKSIIDGCEIAN